MTGTLKETFYLKERERAWFKPSSLSSALRLSR